MRAILLAVLLLAPLALAPAANAHHCTWPTTSSDAVSVGRYYVAPGFRSYVYEESNGIPGLQRGDRDRDDTCHGMVLGDTRLYGG